MTFWRIGLLALLCPVAVSAEELPFAPVPVTVDYVAIRVEVSKIGNGKGITRTIARGGDWTRVGLVPVGDPGAPTSAVFFNAADRLLIKARVSSDARQYLAITRNPGMREMIGLDAVSVRTEEKDKSLDEECEVWSIKSRYGTTLFSCLTQDGIELWRRMGSWEARLTELERRPVSPEEVQPPAGLLTLGPDTSLALPSEGSLTRPDHEVVFKLKNTKRDAEAATVTTRRRCPWSYEEVREGDGHRNISVSNPKAGLDMTYVQRPAEGFEHLSIRQMSLGGQCEFLGEGRFLGLARSEIVLGNLCNWYDLTPKMHDAGRTACFTPDNIMLKSTSWSRGGADNEREAISLRRGPVDAKDVTLPAELLSPAYWGLPG